MNNMPENLHYRVSKSDKGLFKLARIAYWALMVILIIVVCFIIIPFFMTGGFFLFMVFALPITGLFWLVFKMVYPLLGLTREYDYVIEDKGTFRLSYIDGKRRKIKVDVKIKEMKQIAPYSLEDTKASAEVAACTTVINGLPDPKNPGKFAYYAIYPDANGNDAAVTFNITPPVLKSFIFYNADHTVKKDLGTL